jgi:HlyD family secretion protein
VVPLYFQTAGTVKTVYAEPGDYVNAGDVLAELDSTDAWNSYQQAQLNLENAQISLDTLKQPPSENDLKAAQANVASAQAAYGDTANALSSDQLEAQQLKYQQAQDQVTALQAARQNMNGTDDQIALQDAKIGAASFNAEIARLQLEAAQTPNSAALWQASIRITQAQLNLDKLTAGPTQAQLDSAQISIDRAQAALLDAQTAILRTQLIAPRSGTVTAVNIASGDNASPQAAAITLSDLSGLRMTVPVNELDVEKVQAGANATIQLDALPNVTIPGTVEYVGWLSSTSSDGIVTYDVRIDLNTNDPRVRIGMTGEVTIDTGSSAQ